MLVLKTRKIIITPLDPQQILCILSYLTTSRLMTASAQTIREIFLLDRLGKFLFRQELLIPVLDDRISVQPSKTDSTTIGISNLLVIKLTDF